MPAEPFTWTVSEQLRWVAGRHASRLAIIDEHRQLTFEQFHRRVLALAGHLRPYAGGRVGLYLGNRAEWAEAFFACQLAGIAVVPINDRYQAQEVEHLIGDSGLRLVITDGIAHRADVLATLRGSVDTLLVGDEYEKALASAPPAILQRNPESSILYTSGTTALAKGVLLTQENQFNGTFLGPTTLLGTTAADTTLIATPLGHRVGQVRLLGGVLTGGCTVLISDSHPQTLVAAVEKYQITVTGMVPTIARDLSQGPAGIGERLASLRVLSVTGEAMTAELRTRVAQMVPGTDLWTFFASTETGLATALIPDEFTKRPQSSGQALPGIDIALMDLGSGVVSRTGEGEVLVRSGEPGSYAVAAGYVGAAAAGPFVDDAGWFHTGDIGVLDDGGWLAITGRSKDMILSGGFNIAAQEVENVLRQHPLIRDVAVTGEPDERFGERVVAWIVGDPTTGASLSEEELKAFVGDRIAGFKRPRTFHFLTDLPRTATGKVAKWQLGKPSS